MRATAIMTMKKKKRRRRMDGRKEGTIIIIIIKEEQDISLPHRGEEKRTKTVRSLIVF